MYIYHAFTCVMGLCKSTVLKLGCKNFACSISLNVNFQCLWGHGKRTRQQSFWGFTDEGYIEQFPKLSKCLRIWINFFSFPIKIVKRALFSISEGNEQPPAGLLRICRRRRIASNTCLRLRCTTMYGNKNKRLFLVHYTWITQKTFLFFGIQYS